ncbi:hypothetical protein [Nocardia donostiensis]|uniref:Uncharacterized protein n=1 Tax=Nocardia donostiensis TaxID=1538463 RepID=A0A1W0B8L5_9NOCA|nr:hypothetical protein [Nocardia donostiensis]ONM50492.1 hypothetical protein B0T46_00800 [Nocardia donostiensis]OQS18852.1 hypothetical protein B0T44_17200 [Nocardia donostiensis]
MVRFLCALLGATAFSVLAAAPVDAALAHTSAAKSCDLGFMPIKPSVGVGSILGNAWAKCDIPPEHHVLTLSLERREGRAWVAIESTSDATIPSPRHTYAVRVVCGSGPWRVTAHVTGSLQGRPFDFTDSSMERFVSADECTR